MKKCGMRRMKLKLPSFLIAMGTGIWLWIYLLQQSSQILSQAQAQIQPPPQLPKHNTTHNPERPHIRIVEHFEPSEEHGKIMEERLANALLENELRRRDKDKGITNPDIGDDTEKSRSLTVKEQGYHYVPFIRSLNDVDLGAVLEPSKLFCRDDGVLLIAVCCSVEAYEYRQAIRQTWGGATRNSKLGVRVIFTLAQPSEKWKHLQSRINDEAEMHQDILQLKFIDHQANLTLKSMGLFEWVKRSCSGSKFLMKTDDDLFVNIPELLKLLQRFIHDAQDSNMMLGYRIDGAKPDQDRNNQWYTSTDVYLDRVYPTYLSGSAYVVSMDTVVGKLASEAAKETPPFWLEDVFVTGVLRARLGITLVEAPRDSFWFRHRSRYPGFRGGGRKGRGSVKGKGGACAYKDVITGHEVTVEELYAIWKDLHRPDLEC